MRRNTVQAGCDTTSILSGVKLVWIQRFLSDCFSKAKKKKTCPAICARFSVERTDGLLHFSRALVRSEKQTVSTSIWTRVTENMLRIYPLKSDETSLNIWNILFSMCREILNIFNFSIAFLNFGPKSFVHDVANCGVY